VVRGEGETKVCGQTAILASTYKVIVTMSNRFKQPLPLLVDVPGGHIRFGEQLIDN
jgi:diaminopimelate epimerase